MERALPKVLYIAGIGRSGSTILARALGACEGAFAAGEMMHLLGRTWRGIELCGCGKPVQRCEIWGRVIDELRGEGWIRDSGRIEAFRRRVTEGPELPALFMPWQPPWFRRGLRSLELALAAAYGALRSVTGCRLAVDSSKNAGYGRILTGIDRLPVYVLHLVRDSRGVAYSLEKRKRRPGPFGREEYLAHHRPAVGSVYWGAAQVLVESLAARADGYVRVRYRDFVRAPRETLRRALAMAGEYEGPEQLAHVQGGELELELQHLLSGNSTRYLTGTVSLYEDVEWRERMRPSKRALVSALTGPLLYRYGYYSE